MMTKKKLIAFEEKIKRRFLSREILAPIHLSAGNEEPLIEVFKNIRKTDWVFSTHRSHYHALLHGIDPNWLEKEIVEGRSIHIFNKDHNFFSSAIVGGCLPIALGVALGIKLGNKSSIHVWVFIGDMAAETGAFHECTKYARRHGLPITFVVEDNGVSTNTPTQEAWGLADIINGNTRRYYYKRECDHVGAGQWVSF